MSLQTRISALITAIGVDIKTLTTRIGTLANLTTTDKTNLVSAINEVKASVGSAGATINDTTPSGTTVYSSNKTDSQITAAITALINGAPGALDTLNELAVELAAQDSVSDGLVTAVANRVRFDAPQTLDTTQQAQACTNIGVGNPEVDLAALYVTAKA
ncbi:MAG TPA: hypothetical protein VF680_17450 [Allosphingosinicella sp.]|jgi:purine-nucleoside phosphorylase